MHGQGTWEPFHIRTMPLKWSREDAGRWLSCLDRGCGGKAKGNDTGRAPAFWSLPGTQRLSSRSPCSVWPGEAADARQACLWSRPCPRSPDAGPAQLPGHIQSAGSSQLPRGAGAVYRLWNILSPRSDVSKFQPNRGSCGSVERSKLWNRGRQERPKQAAAVGKGGHGRGIRDTRNLASKRCALGRRGAHACETCHTTKALPGGFGGAGRGRDTSR